MSRKIISQLSSNILKIGNASKIFYASCSKSSSGFQIENVGNYQQATYYTAKDVEFCPNRAKEVMQNNVEETSEKAVRNDTSISEKNTDSTVDDEHMKAYQADNSVSLYSVMQSNVPEPFNTCDKAPTHLNMPGNNEKTLLNENSVLEIDVLLEIIWKKMFCVLYTGILSNS
ncbi:uncharacterized protein TNIN_258701 [Trichonephila inaurata madagascariensis]|uniref:Uncharacterized protein n=1 Tax=Trichonephila inaurata madagascariensis TaxID=2747483 RepID=A0A8X6MJL0_9ARAC|nr:uncharacterized protein TNIN_258701 [Trichonephila inaurata madagascariensis]